MDKIKSPDVAGKFYTSDKERLLAEFRALGDKSKDRPLYEETSRAIIVPHAGYMYSGELAYKGFQHLDKNVKNIFIFAPSHFEQVTGAGALSSHDKWSTPLGEIAVNQEINLELERNFECEFFDAAFEQEHSVEVQVPFIQHFIQHASADVKIIPILTGYHGEKIEKIINHFYDNPENAFVISSDLSHFHKDSDARKIDSTTAQMIEMGEIDDFTTERACGGIGVCALTQFAASRGFSLIRVGLINSSDKAGGKESVVGYGSWLLYEGDRTGFIKKHFSSTLLEAARIAIKSGFEKVKMFEVPPALKQYVASFVTLELDGELRGCIGSIIAHRPLIDDVMENAHSSAYRDPRFLPLKKEEFERVSIAISLLTVPTQITFRDEDDLLSQIVPYDDGIIIKEGPYQAVYLPSVWEQIPDKREFLNSLKQKAGLQPDYFSPTFKAFRFRAEYIK